MPALQEVSRVAMDAAVEEIGNIFKTYHQLSPGRPVRHCLGRPC